MNTKIKTALIGAVALIIGNVVTALGPALFSWGWKPEFVMSDIYRELRRENPKLEPTLEKQLLERELYYKAKSYDINFAKINNGMVKIYVTTTTEIRNSTDKEKDYEHVVIFNSNGFNYQNIKITSHDGKTEIYDQQRIRSEVSMKLGSGDIKYTFGKQKIPPKESITIESNYHFEKPVKNNEEAFVTNRLVNSNVTYQIHNNTNDPNFSFGWSSLAFPEELPPSNGDKMNPKITIPGPVFTGQGIALTWDSK